MTIKNRSGFTLLEVMIGIVMMVILFIAVLKLFAPIRDYFARSSASQKTTMEARIAMDTISRALREGVPTTLTICNCVNPTIINNPPLYCASPACTSNTIPSNSPPNSQIEFNLQGGTTYYTIYWAQNTIQMRADVTINGTLYPKQTTLSTSASNLSFSQSAADSAVVFVTLASSTAYTGAGSNGQTANVTYDREEIHMLAGS